MASYDAVIKLVVQGEDALKRIQERVDKLYKTIDDLERKKKYAGSQAAAEFVREQADELERVVAISKKIIKEDERRIVQQSKLNAAVDLYQRRLQQTVNSGATGVKKFREQIAQIENAFKFFKKRENVQAIRALATELGRMVEYSNSVSRNERARADNQSKVFKYVKAINAYEEQGLDVSEARLKMAEFTKVANSNQLNDAKKYSEAVERQLSLLKEQVTTQKLLNAETAQLKQGLNRLEEEQRNLENSKLDEKARQIQVALDKQAAAAAETAAQIDKLNQRQSEFIARTDEAAQAASRQTAEFYRQQRIAKEVAKINAAAPPPQLLLPPAAPGAPAMSGGARRPITGPVERLGGARTQDQADVALRFAEALKEQVRPLSQINSLYAGIYGEAIKLASVKALPSTEMLNAAARGLQTIEAIEARRLSTAERRAQKVRQLQEYAAESGVPIPGLEMLGGVQPPKFKAPFGQRATEFLKKPGVADALIGGSFPALFGGGPGAIAGGVIGGLAGGGMGGGPMGMALSLAASAVGQKFDEVFGKAIRATQELGQALSRLDVEKLRESSVYVTSNLENQIRLLLEAGKYEQARAVVGKQIADQTGSVGKTIERSSRATTELQVAWQLVSNTVNTLLAALTVDAVQALTGILRLVNMVARGVNVVVTGSRNLIDKTAKWIITLFTGEKAYNRAQKAAALVTQEGEKMRAASEANIDAGVREIQLKNQLLDIERSRLEGTNRLARQSQIEADYATERAKALSDEAEKKREIYSRSSLITARQLQMELDIAEANTKQRIEGAAITKEKGQQKLLNDALIAGLQDQADAAKNQAENYALVNSSATKILQIEEQRLQQRLQFATSLNQESALIDRITANRKQQAEVEYQAQVRSAQAAVEDAARQYDIVKTKHAAKQVDDEALNTAIRNLNTAVLSRDVETQIAGLKREQGLETAEIQGRQQQLNAYAEDYKRTNESISRELDAQSNALSNRASLLSAISQATQTINNIEIESLTRELERTSSVREREKILEKIYHLEVENAKAVLQATRAQIQAELQRAEVAYRKVLLEQKMLEAVVAIAKAQGIVTREHYEALKIQEDALAIAKHNVDTAVQIADVQWKAADAVFKAAVDAAKLKKEMGGVADAAGQFAGNMERAASAAGTMVGTPFAVKGGAEEIQDPALKAQAQKIWQEAEAFAATKGIASIQADILQRARDAIARIAFRDYTLRTKAATSTVSAPATITSTATAPSTTPIPTTQPLAAGLSMQPGGGAGTAIVDRMPTINLQTGPVLQQEDGSKYVSLGDLEKILQDFATVVFNNARSAGGRRFQGVN